MSEMLYVNGCSWTFGDKLSETIMAEDMNSSQVAELKALKERRFKRTERIDLYDSVLTKNEDLRRNKAWPGVLCKRLNYGDHQNDARPGGSNDRIVRTTLDWLVTHTPRLVIVGWTHPARTEFWDKVSGKFITFSIHIKPRHNLDFWQNYWELTYNKDVTVYRSLQQIILLQTLLKHYNIPYLFFNAISTVPSKQEGFEHLRKKIDWDFFLTEFTFREFVLHKKLNLIKGSHPDELAHESWAKYLYEQLKLRSIL